GGAGGGGLRPAWRRGRRAPGGGRRDRAHAQQQRDGRARGHDLRPRASMKHTAVLGPGRIGRQIALAFALGGSRVSLVDVKERPAGGAAAVFADARREIRRDLGLMAEEGVIPRAEIAPALDPIEERSGLARLREGGYLPGAL